MNAHMTYTPFNVQTERQAPADCFVWLRLAIRCTERLPGEPRASRLLERRVNPAINRRCVQNDRLKGILQRERSLQPPATCQHRPNTPQATAERILWPYSLRPTDPREALCPPANAKQTTRQVVNIPAATFGSSSGLTPPPGLPVPGRWPD